MTDNSLQKTLGISDGQVARLRQNHGDWNGETFVPTAISLPELIRMTIVDAVGEQD